MIESIPTLGEKISRLIKESQYKTPHAFHKAIIEMSGKDAIPLKSLYNVLNDQHVPKETTLFQIAAALDVGIFDLRKGTTSEPPAEGPSRESSLIMNRLPYITFTTAFHSRFK